MKIAVNTRLLLDGRMEGIGWFSYESLKRITNQHLEHQFIFIFDRLFSDKFIFSSNIIPVVLPPPTRHWALWYLWFEYSIPRILNRHKVDFFLSPDGFLSLNSKIPSLAVIHDINFVHKPEDLPRMAGWYYRHFFPKYAQKATRVATVSEYSKADICKTFDIPTQKVDVLYNGANEVFMPVNEETKLTMQYKISNGKPYFVFIGAMHPRKNVERLLLAFEQFKNTTHDSEIQDFNLVIVGREMFKTRQIKAIFDSMKFKNKVIFTGHLSITELRDVLASAFALTFVPYFEGFGIPIVEAMYCGVPVITSNVTSMPEVGGQAVLYVDPYSVESIANAMLKLVNENKLRNELIDNGLQWCRQFTWDNTANRLWNSILKCFD